MTCLRSLTAWTLLFSVLSVGSARAAQIEMRTYRLEGNIYDVTDHDGVVDSSIQVGSPFSMTVSIPADTPNDVQGSNSQYYGTYNFPVGVPGAGITLSIAGTPIDVGIPNPLWSASVNVSPGVTPGEGLLTAHQHFTKTFEDGYTRATRLEFDFQALANVIQNTALPDSLSLADFQSAVVSLVIFQGQNPTDQTSIALGQVTSLEVTNEMVSIEVPEPSTGLLFGIAALGGLGYNRLRRRRQ